MGYFEPDDDSDKATKNTYRYAKRALDKFQSEISFFYDPREFDRMLSSGGILPAISLFSELSRFITDLTMETTGLDISNLDKTSEEVRKSAQPIKKLGKMLPITRSIFTYAPLFSEEFAKEYDITVQEKARQ
jgi:5-bromo-4-chloroindolyl phosphate hydrolysis protein